MQTCAAICWADPAKGVPLRLFRAWLIGGGDKNPSCVWVDARTPRDAMLKLYRTWGAKAYMIEYAEVSKRGGRRPGAGRPRKISGSALAP
jgi:hypothetical protein